MFLRIVFIALLVLTAIVANSFINTIPNRKSFQMYRPLYGISYSFEHASWFGLNSKDAYKKILDDVRPDWVRAPFFWDVMTDENGDLRVDDLKFAIEEAQKRNIKVVIALGLKTPYYPELHLPKKIDGLVGFGDKVGIKHPVADKLLEIDRKLVLALAPFPNIIYWQVENEPLLGNSRAVTIDPGFIKAEVDAVREADFAKRPVILNHPASGFYDRKWELLLPILNKGDIFATNAYFVTKGSSLFSKRVFGLNVVIPWPKFFSWPVQSWPLFSPNFAKIKSKVESNGNDLWVMESQAEPYIQKLSEASGSKFNFEATDIEKSVNFLKSFGIKSIGLWGAQFWQFRDVNGDSSWISAVEGLTSQKP